jgi:hypothetical protein
MDDFLSNSRVSVSDRIVQGETRHVSFWESFAFVFIILLIAFVTFYISRTNLLVLNGTNERVQPMPSFLAISKTLSDGRLMRSSAYRFIAPTSIVSPRRSFIDNKSITEWTQNVANKI